MPCSALLGIIDLAFLASNALKIVQGGWLPLAVAAGVFVVMDTWRVGRRLHLEKLRDNSLALDLFLDRADKINQRIAGTAVFMSARSDVVPNALLHSLKHYKVMHERVVLASVSVADTPFVPHGAAGDGGETGQGLFRGALPVRLFRNPQLARRPGGGAGAWPGAGPGFLHLLPGRETLVPGEHPSLPAGGWGSTCGWRRTPCRPRATITCRRAAWWSWGRR